MTKNGWRSGTDPVQRWLRILTALVCLGVFVFLAIRPDNGVDDLPVGALALGAVLLLLGYESVVALPVIGRPSPRDRADRAKQEDRDP